MPERSGFGAAAAHQADGRGQGQNHPVGPAQISASAASHIRRPGFAAFRKNQVSDKGRGRTWRRLHASEHGSGRSPLLLCISSSFSESGRAPGWMTVSRIPFGSEMYFPCKNLYFFCLFRFFPLAGLLPMSSPTATLNLRAPAWAHPPASAGPAVIARRMETAFSGRTWSIGGIEGESRCQAFLVIHGEGAFADAGGTIVELSAPFMLWLPRLALG